MSEHEFDPWATTSGMVMHFDADISDCRFEFDPEYNDGDTLLLKMEAQSDDSEVGLDGNGHDTLQFTCGRGWTTNDKGKTAVHESGKAKNFNNKTGMGELIESAKQVDGLIDILKSKGDGSHVAAIWDGLNLTFDRVENSFVNNEGETIKFYKLHVTGINSGGTKGKAATETKAEGKSSGEAKAEAGGSGDGGSDSAIPETIKFKLKKLAKAVSDHDEFVEKAFTEVDGVAGEDAIESAVMDEEYFESLRA